MKKIVSVFLFITCALAFASCGSGTGTSTGGDSTAATQPDSSANTGSTAGFKLGVQMWTFNHFTFTEALDKVDSAGIKNIEAFWGQKLGGGLPGEFGDKMTADTRTKLKALLQKKGITMVAMGVITPNGKAEWIKALDLAKDMGLSYITCEPVKTQWDLADSLSGVYGIRLAIHDHPKPNVYWSPDSVAAAIKGHANIGSCADVGHWARNGVKPQDALKQLEGHIFGVHLKDVKTFDNKDAEDTAVSHGVVDFPAVFAELKRQNFSGMLSIEQESNFFHNLTDVIATKKFYEDEIAKLK